MRAGKSPRSTDEGDSDDDSDRKTTHSSQPNYRDTAIPSKPPEDYHYTERRAELYQQIMDLGHPSYLNQSEAADRYGVAQSTISRDVKAISEHVNERLADRDRRALEVEAALNRAIRGLIEDGDWRDLSRTVFDLEDWRSDHHDLAELWDLVERLEDTQ